MPKKTLKYINDEDPWMLAEDIPDMDVFFAQIWQSCFVNEFEKPNGRSYKKLLSIQRGYHLWFYFGKSDSAEVGEHIAGRIVKNPKWAVLINKQIIRWADRLRAFAETIPQENLNRLSNRQLWQWYHQHDVVHTAYYQWCWIPVGADMFHNNLTNRLQQYLRTLVPEAKVNECLVTLTQPRTKSLIQLEREEFLLIASMIYRDGKQRRIFQQLYDTFQEQEVSRYGLQTHTPEYERLLEERTDRIKDQIKPSVLKKIQEHYQRYFYVKFLWVGKEGTYSFDYYVKELVKLIGSGANPIRELQRIQKEFNTQVNKQRSMVRQLKIRDPWLTIFQAWGDFMVTKIYRRYAQIYAIYRMQEILREIASRLRLTLKEVRLMLQGEIRQALLTGRLDRRSTKARSSFAIFYYERGNETIITGQRAAAMARQAETVVVREAAEITGQVGCVGRARGTVRIIIRPKDMVKMKQGDILVSIATDPDIVPAMKKAAAIVTEQGGVTSHAAIVSRELNIPCVIGTKIATKVLKDGDMVEVDATRGIVKKI